MLVPLQLVPEARRDLTAAADSHLSITPKETMVDIPA
jgi:hypothetical protein